jgi:hypothetical protein
MVERGNFPATAMQSDDLSRDQARALKNKLHPMLGYLTRLRKRMAARGFTQDDPLLQVVQRAEMAMHELHVAVHYLSCGDTAGGLPRRSTAQREKTSDGAHP